MISVDEIAATYDAWAPTYDGDVNPTRDLDAAVLRLQPFEFWGAHAIELGCGTGKNTGWLAEHARRITAIDFSERMLGYARQKVVPDRVDFVRADVTAGLPIRDSSGDLVVGDLVLEHIEEG